MIEIQDFNTLCCLVFFSFSKIRDKFYGISYNKLVLAYTRT